jgi:hypothetical protein
VGKIAPLLRGRQPPVAFKKVTEPKKSQQTRSVRKVKQLVQIGLDVPVGFLLDVHDCKNKHQNRSIESDGKTRQKAVPFLLLFHTALHKKKHINQRDKN